MTQYLYLIKCQQFYKIGVANDVDRRLAELSTGNPFPLEVINVYGFGNAQVVESAIHQRFSWKRQRGEWFALDDNDLLQVRHICEVLGGSYEIAVELPTDDDIREADDIQADDVFEYDPETMRTEARSSDGKIRGIVIMTRTSPKKSIAYFGARHSDFNKYLELYKAEHSKENP